MKRQADITRKALLDSAREIVAEFGAINFTLEAVAARAGVSKGALLHHFPTKKGLVEAMVRDLVEQFGNTCSELIAKDPHPKGRSARAYVQAIANQSKAEYEQFSAMSVAFISDMSLMHIWRKGIAEALAADAAECEDPTDSIIVRLAADGMWTSDLYGTYGLESAQRKRILDKLIAMTRS